MHAVLLPALALGCLAGDPTPGLAEGKRTSPDAGAWGEGKLGVGIEPITTPAHPSLGECADGGDVDRMVCFTATDDGRDWTLIRLDLGPGTRRRVATVSRPGAIDSSSFIVEGSHAWLCSDKLYRWELATGTMVEGAPSCDEVFKHADGVVLKGSGWPTGAQLYADLDDALADREGTPVTVNAEADSTSVTAWGDLAVGAHHSTDSVDLYHLSNGTWNRTTVLEDWDTWVWGIAATGGAVIMVDDGRRPTSGGARRIAAHDLADGTLLWERLYPGRPGTWYRGLSCGCKDDAGVTWTDNDLDGELAEAWGGADCDDADPLVAPGLVEACDGIDQDCDGGIDEGACGTLDLSSTELENWVDHQDGDISTTLVVPDLTGDGQEDLLVGEQYAEIAGNEYAGQVWLVPGPVDGGVVLAEAGSILFQGDEYLETLGASLADLGDVDGDGVSDLAIGARRAESNAGRAYVVPGLPGATEVIDDVASLRIDGTSGTQYTGEVVGGVRDLLVVGETTLVVLAPRYESVAGGVFLFPADTTGHLTLDDASVVFQGSSGGTELYAAVENAGDLDGDGVGDLLLHSGKFADMGAVFLAQGPVGAGTALDDLPMVRGVEPEGSFGSSVALVGDLDSDGYDDFAARHYLDGTDWTRVGLFLGPFPGGDTSDDADAWMIATQRDGGHYGEAILGPGDLDGDGAPELVVSEESLDDGDISNLGAVHLYTAPYAGLVPLAASWRGSLEGEDLGFGLSGRGDLTGDGLPDVVVLAPDAHDGAQGTAFVLGLDDL